MFWKNRFGYAIIFATIMSLLFWSDVFYKVNHQVSDALYQQVQITSPEICIIGIDADTIDVLGGFPFDRDYYAQIIALLNQQETPPIALGVDVLFTGETQTTSDVALVEEVASYDNVVLACSANYSTALVVESADQFYVDSNHITSMNYPFASLKEVAQLGHINSSLDQDGILRQATLYIQNQDGEEIPSLNLALYQEYCDFYGMDLGELPENQWYLPFTSKSGGYYDGYSFHKVLSGEIPPSVFSDKLVLIGPYTIGLQDHFFTAIDHTNLMYGVEYQANALEVLINKNYVVSPPVATEYLFLFLISFVFFLLCYEKKLVFSGSLLLGTGVVYLLLCKALYGYGLIVHVFYLPFVLLVLFLLNIIVDALRSSIEKARVTATFKRYVAPVVVEELLKEDAKNLGLGGVTRHISVMFLDIRGFTTLSEQQEYKEDPQKLVNVLNQFMDVMASTITENGGTLDKFIGDAIMCFWGAPLVLSPEEHTKKAVETALQIVENIQPIAKEVEEKNQQKVVIGIGIQCGNAVVGNIGSQNRMDYTVIGDTVNTAQRLESNAKVKEGETPRNLIIISGEVRDLVKDIYTCVPVEGGLKLKGKEGQFEAYSVVR